MLMSGTYVYVVQAVDYQWKTDEQKGNGDTAEIIDLRNIESLPINPRGFFVYRAKMIIRRPKFSGSFVYFRNNLKQNII